MNFRVGDRVLIEAQIEGRPPRRGTVTGIGGQATALLDILVEFDGGEEYWCDPSELQPAKGK
jgi:hypothetical protein